MKEENQFLVNAILRKTVEYKHTVELDASSKTVRFYLWLWQASPSQINLCKIFWGYVFFWLALTLHGIAWVIRKMEVRRWKRQELVAERAFKINEPILIKERKLREPSKLLDSIEMTFLKVSMWFSSHWHWMRWIWFALLGAFLIILVLVLIALIVMFWKFVLILLAWLVGTLTAGFIISGIAVLLEKKGAFGKVGEQAGHSFERVLGFFRLLWKGAKAVKYRTCPEIKIRGANEEGKVATATEGNATNL